ncbi:MAG: hypothetical protein GX118_02865 [Arcobacter butzleri]|nr:hypothetical protein [Aliarcobacter butzleri]
MISIVKTKDGSNTLFSKEYNQCYHNIKDGAINESLYKHILPALEFYEQKESLKVLDICFGLGYNTFLTIIENEKLANPKKIEFYSPELDLALINSLAKFEYPKEFDKIEHIIKAISKDLYYEDEYYKIEIFNGDARKFIKTLKEIDIVYQDPFSSDVNSELWNLEYFYNLYQATSSNPIITTYSIATNVRLSMSENGFLIYEIRNLDTRKSTLAFKKPQNRYKYIDMQLKKQNNPLAKAID